jgi:hypothetical protein
MVESLQGRLATDSVTLTRKLDAAGWGLFSIWIGITMFTHADKGTFLLGMGIIILAAQAVRKYELLKFDAFWAVAGSLFVVGGIWNLLNVKLDLFPFLFIAAGVGFLISTMAGKRSQ